jgi:EAL domain-containing protein (putative c-di-GMP-specific phosphodiesterase class I)/GGDEF domain-containing protein
VQQLRSRWPAIAVAASFMLSESIFYFGGPEIKSYSALIGVVPIAVAAWLFGARVAVAVLVLEGLANYSLVSKPGGTSRDITVDVIEGAALAAVAISVGVTHRAKRRLAQALATDPVTLLSNRQGFVQQIDRALRLGTNVTIGMLDLLDVSDVNETFGFEIGDELLRGIAARLRAAFPAPAYVAKGDSNRFAVGFPAFDGSDEALAERLLATVALPFVVSGAELRPRVRASVTRRDTVGARKANEMTRAALKALDTAARHGQAWRSAERAETTGGMSRLDMLGDLSRAIAKGELRLHYQPIVDLTSGSLQSLEALVRWQHPGRGLVPPLDFIPLAEQSGLIVPLTEWVLDEALRQSRDWADQSLRIPVSVNVGAKTLLASAALPAVVERLLKLHGVEAGNLCLEITETDVMTDPTHAATVLAQLKALGVRVEIDDFGTGYSSLAYLQKLPVDGVKIDRSFVAPLLDHDNTAAIVRAAIDLSHALGLDAVAEGVEDAHAFQLLKEMGCDAAQGYLIARPMRGAEVISWAADFAARTGVAPVAPTPQAWTAEPDKTAPGSSRGTVLVVDDEHPFRLAAHRVLTAQGYRVIHAATASEALRVCAEEKGNVSLLLTDVHLTDWQGDELAAHLQATYPGLRTMFMSGDRNATALTGTNSFLAKPFSNRELVESVAGAMAS